MLVIVGSKNPVKINATQQAFETYFSDIQVKGLNTSSGVKPFPTSDEEMIQGAINRANTLSKSKDADYYVGLEGGLQTINEYSFVKQVAVVKSGDKIGVGFSSGYIAPVALLKKLDWASDESRKIIDEYFGRNEVLSGEGVVGVLTNGVLTRTSTSYNAVICALTKFINSHYY